jgi:hypothetical protein
MAMVGASGGAGAGTGFDLAGMRGATRRRPAQPVAVPAAEAAALPEGAVPSTEGADEAVPPPMSGTTFLQQWSAGLTGSAEGPTQACILLSSASERMFTHFVLFSQANNRVAEHLSGPYSSLLPFPTQRTETLPTPLSTTLDRRSLLPFKRTD